MLRQEMSNMDSQGRAIIRRAEDRGGHKYFSAFSTITCALLNMENDAKLYLDLLSRWIEDNLELYKVQNKTISFEIVASNGVLG